MRHHKKIRTLGRDTGGRRALLRSLALSLIEREKIDTTEARAKELRPFVERLIALGKKGSISAQKVIAARLGGNRTSAQRVVKTLAPRFAERPGGFTRIVKLPIRVRDAARRARIEFVA